MSNKGLLAKVALTPSGEADAQVLELSAKSIATGVPRASINWVYPAATAYLDEDPKNRHFYTEAMLADAYAIAFTKALESGAEVSESDIKFFAKVLGDWETVFTGENILFYIQWIRDFEESVSASDDVAKLLQKPLQHEQSVSDGLAKLMSLPKNESITPADSYALLTGLLKTESISAPDFQTLQSDLVKSETLTVSQLFDRVVSFIRDFSDLPLLTDELAKLVDKPLPTLSVSITEDILVGLVYEKFYDDTVYTNIRGDLFNDGLLGQYVVNQSIGGEFLALDFTKSLSDAPSPEDSYDRVLSWFRDFGDSQAFSDLVNAIAFIKVSEDSVAPSDSYADVKQFFRAPEDVSSPSDSNIYSLLKILATSSNEPQDQFDRTVQYSRGFDSGVLTVDTADFNSGDGLEYQFQKGLSDAPVVTDQIFAGLELIRIFSDRLNVNPEDVPLNAHVLNLFALNDSPGGDRFSYQMRRATPSDVINGPMINANVMNGNFTP